MKPIFEIIDGKKHYKIYENGQIEGFRQNAVVFNRLPGRILQEITQTEQNKKKIEKVLVENMVLVNRINKIKKILDKKNIQVS
jgi:hypothetical protein